MYQVLLFKFRRHLCNGFIESSILPVSIVLIKVGSKLTAAVESFRASW